MATMRRFLLHSLGIVILLGAVYGRAVFWNDFVEWDDGLLITKNPIIQEFSFRSVGKAFTSYDPELYIPLTFLSYQIDHLMWGLNPVGFHLTNLVLHTANAILVFFLVQLLLRDFGLPNVSRLLPLLVALLFAVHPLNTEVVVWASARKDLLSGFFFLLTVILYLHSRESSSSNALRPPSYPLSLFSFFLGLLAKVSIIMTPLVLLLLEWLPLQSQRDISKFSMSNFQFSRNSQFSILNFQFPAKYITIFPYLLLSLVFGIVAMGGKEGNVELLSEKILIGTKATAFYLGKIFRPSGLSVLYPYTQPITWSNPDFLFPLLLVLTFSVAAFLLRRRTPLVTFGWVFFLLMLLPSFTNFAKGHDQLRDVYFASDRYAYLPSLGIFLLCISLIYNLQTTHYTLLTGILSFLILPLTLLSHRQSLVWRNTETLFRNVVDKYPESHVAWNNLGSITLERSDLQTAVTHYEHSLRIRPNAAAFFNMGQIALRNGHITAAMEFYRQAILSRPNDTDALINLGVLHLRSGNTTQAADLFQRAIAFDDRLPIAHFNLGLALEALGDGSGARRAFTRVLELDPRDRETKEKLARLQGKE